MKKIHYLQHVPFEDPANIFKWAKQNNIQIEGTKLYQNDSFPDIQSFDMLVVMGGPMGIYDEEEYPWLKEEKEFIKKAIDNDKLVLGICLGAQLIADVLGAKVYRNKEKEIGWFPVELTKEAKNSNIFKDFPNQFMAFHWHGDTFDIRAGAIHTVRSEACENQAFEYNDGRVIALQFHLETTPESAKKLIENSQEELKEKGKYIQSPDEMLNNKEYFEDIEKLLFQMLNKLVNLGNL